LGVVLWRARISGIYSVGRRWCRTHLGYVLRVSEPSRIYFVLRIMGQDIEWLQKKKKKETRACMRTHENRVRNDGLRLSRRGGWVVIVRIVPLSRKRSRRGVGRGPIGQRGSTDLQCGSSRERKPENAGHIGAPKIPRVCARERSGRKEHGPNRIYISTRRACSLQR
jgi:hypothetical protein